MKVYITYDRYENNEWFNVYNITTCKRESIKHCKEVDLVDFINYGPDDCLSFQLQEVNLTKKQYEQLLEWDKDDTMSLEHPDSPYYQFMCEIYENASSVRHQNEILISSYGCSDFYEIVTYYGVNYKGEDPEDFDSESDNFYDYQEELCDNEDLFIKITKEYINDTY